MPLVYVKQDKNALLCVKTVLSTTLYCFHSTLAFGPYSYVTTQEPSPPYCTFLLYLPTIPPYCTYLTKLTWHEHGIPNHSWPMPGQLPPKAASESCTRRLPPKAASKSCPQRLPQKLPPKASLKAAPESCP